MSENRGKKLRGPILDVDEEASCLIVTYESDGVKKRKKIAAQVTETTNVLALAHKIVDKYSEILASSQISLIETLLYQLQGCAPEPKETHAVSKAKKKEKSTQEVKAKHERERGDETRTPVPVEALPAAKIENLDQYMERLYDDTMEAKVQAVGMMVQLCKKSENLEQLVQNETLMGVLSRVLADEYKKSVDLTLNLMRFLWCCSIYRQMHPILSNFRVGANTMKVVEFELKRYQLRLEEEKATLQALERSIGPNDPEATRKAREKARRSFKAAQKKQEKLLYVCFQILGNLAEDIHVQRKMVKKSIVENLIEILQRPTPQLVSHVLSLLKKLSVFEENKEKMIQCGAVECCLRLISHRSEQVAQTALRVLFNLSYDVNARDRIVKNGGIPLLAELLQPPPFCGRIVVSLLYHLSIDEKSRALFAQQTETALILQRFIRDYKQPLIAKELGALAINLTSVGRNAEMMLHNSTVPAAGISASSTSASSSATAGGERDGGGLKELLRRVLEYKDPLVIKIIRNLSLWTYRLQEDPEAIPDRHIQKQHYWTPKFVAAIVKLAQSSEGEHEILVETLGTLANITPTDLEPKSSWALLCTEFDLLPFIYKLLLPGFAQDDIVLEVINLIATMSLDQDFRSLIAGEKRLLQMLADLLTEKSDDEEIILQILFLLQRLMHSKEILETFLFRCDITEPLFHYLQKSKHRGIRTMADRVLGVIAENDRDERGVFSSAVGAKIQAQRFESYNDAFMKSLAILEASSPAAKQTLKREEDDGRRESEREGKGHSDDEDEGNSRSDGIRSTGKKNNRNAKKNGSGDGSSERKQRLSRSENIEMDMRALTQTLHSNDDDVSSQKSLPDGELHDGEPVSDRESLDGDRDAKMADSDDDDGGKRGD